MLFQIHLMESMLDIFLIEDTEVIRLLIEMTLPILDFEYSPVPNPRQKEQIVGIFSQPKFLSKLLTFIKHWPQKYQPILLLFCSKLLKSKQFLKSFFKVQGNETLFNLLNKSQYHKHRLGILNCIKKSLNYQKFNSEYKKMGAIPILVQTLK